MAQTYFQDFIRTSGEVITVEYTYTAGSDTTYSPLYGADGGDGAEIEILKAWIEPSGEDIQLPDEERERYEEWIVANVEPPCYEPD